MLDTNGTLVLGKYLLSAELTRSEWGALAVAGIMAHEFGHIYQFQTEFGQRLTQSQPTSKLLELHADYLGGYHIGLKRLRDGEIDAEVFMESLYLKGDNDFTNRDHHGTPEERATAMLAGYKTGLTNNRSIHQVAEMGVTFVHNI
ncbi:MAG: hypothetical protein Q7U57_15835 [Methylovulum sp.]|nr:hypothetical protein [Methylovulum sp.]